MLSGGKVVSFVAILGQKCGSFSLGEIIFFKIRFRIFQDLKKKKKRSSDGHFICENNESNKIQIVLKYFLRYIDR